MPQNTSPIFILTPNTPTATIATASTSRDGSGTLTTLFTAGANGSRVDSVTFTSAQLTAAASSAMVQRIFLTDTGGANPRLIAEVATATVTPSTTAVGAQSIVNFTNGLLMQSGQILKVSQSVYASVADQFHVHAKGGDY